MKKTVRAKRLAFQKKLGAHIATLREERNLSQSELARLAGKDRQNFNAIEQGKNMPTVNTLLDISEALGLQPKDLLNF